MKMNKAEIIVKPYSVCNDYFVIYLNKGCWACLVPVEKSEQYKGIFESCQTGAEIQKAIDSLK